MCRDSYKCRLRSSSSSSVCRMSVEMNYSKRSSSDPPLAGLASSYKTDAQCRRAGTLIFNKPVGERATEAASLQVRPNNRVCANRIIGNMRRYRIEGKVAEWLRRCVQVAVRKSMGSNPILVIPFWSPLVYI